MRICASRSQVELVALRDRERELGRIVRLLRQCPVISNEGAGACSFAGRNRPFDRRWAQPPPPPLSYLDGQPSYQGRRSSTCWNQSVAILRRFLSHSLFSPHHLDSHITYRSTNPSSTSTSIDTCTRSSRSLQVNDPTIHSNMAIPFNFEIAENPISISSNVLIWCDR